ncbi:hypothetical protein ACWCPT_14740 [Streptomyces sp. NPDC002308]
MSRRRRLTPAKPASETPFRRAERVPVHGAEGALLGYLGHASANDSVALATAGSP